MERYTLDYIISELENPENNIDLANSIKSICLELKEVKENQNRSYNRYSTLPSST